MTEEDSVYSFLRFIKVKVWHDLQVLYYVSLSNVGTRQNVWDIQNWGVIFGKFFDLLFVFINTNHSKKGQVLVKWETNVNPAHMGKMEGKLGRAASEWRLSTVKWLWNTGQSEDYSSSANWTFSEQGL